MEYCIHNKDYSGPLLNSSHQWLNDQPNPSVLSRISNSSATNNAANLSFNDTTFYNLSQQTTKLCKQQLKTTPVWIFTILMETLHRHWCCTGTNSWGDIVNEITTISSLTLNRTTTNIIYIRNQH
ncbi:hypothetical protein GQX74_013111 [Glossina fuscipes]|nr:hypothetical protein GQX74_013111 [Glossina fuscipes]